MCKKGIEVLNTGIYICIRWYPVFTRQKHQNDSKHAFGVTALSWRHICWTIHWKSCRCYNFTANIAPSILCPWKIGPKTLARHKNLIHPWNLTWNLKRSPWKRRFLSETIIFRFHVNFRGSRFIFPRSIELIISLCPAKGLATWPSPANKSQ